jgi:hypothetical protein
MKHAAPVLLALALVTATGCGGKSTPAAVVTTTPPPTLPPIATDKAGVTAVVVTAADLGAPWVQPKAVNRTKTGKGELCPGKKEDFAREVPRASVSVQMTEGTKAGAAIASFELAAFDPARLDAWRAAFAAAVTDCKAYRAIEKNYVTVETATAPAVAGADEVLARLEHVYADAAHKQLSYVRQVLKCRVGRVVVSLEHAFIQPKTDPTGADFTKTAGLAEKQVAKVKTSFAQ